MKKQIAKILSAEQAALYAKQTRESSDVVNVNFDNIIIINTGALICISRTGADPLREVYQGVQKFFSAYGV